MRVTSKGQVTIPQEIRERFGLVPGTEVEFVVKRNSVHLVKTTSPKRQRRGVAVVRRLRGSATIMMSTGEILALTRK